MKPIQSNEIQPMLLEILHAFDLFCKENALNYFATAGTLLGAVRHKGFIPWDDDVDLCMKTDDMERLLKIAEKDPYIDSDRRFQILLPSKLPNIYPFIKLIDTHTILYERGLRRQYSSGIYLDIFLLSRWPADPQAAEKLLLKQRNLKKMLYVICGMLDTPKFKKLYPLIVPLRTLLLALGLNSDYWSRKIYYLGCSKPTGYIGNLNWGFYDERFPESYYDKSLLLPFEDMLLPVPTEYDAILRQFYGDYMQIPPPEKQVRHDFEAYHLS